MSNIVLKSTIPKTGPKPKKSTIQIPKYKKIDLSHVKPRVDTNNTRKRIAIKPNLKSAN